KSDRGREYATAAAVAVAVQRLRGRTPAVLVSSFLPSALAALRELAPGIPRGVLFRLIPRGWAELARRLGCTMIGADQRRLRPRPARAPRGAGGLRHRRGHSAGARRPRALEWRRRHSHECAVGDGGGRAGAAWRPRRRARADPWRHLRRRHAVPDRRDLGPLR